MDMIYFNKTVVTIYEKPSFSEIKTLDDGRSAELSSITDEGLYGMPVVIADDPVNTDENDEFVKIRTFYSYEGYVRREDLTETQHEYPLRVVNALYSDILSFPKVEGMPLLGVTRGCLIEDTGERVDGYAKVRLLDGREGYLPGKYLSKLIFPIDKFDERGTAAEREKFETDLKKLIDENFDGSEDVFRRSVADTAKSYLGVQYRWGGKSPLGLDCSGLTSMSYMLNGVLIYRNARLIEGFPVRKIERSDIKTADLLYFEGHIAMYLGDGYYIHSTARTGSNGVVINSLVPDDPLYREDLDEGMIAAGTVF